MEQTYYTLSCRHCKIKYESQFDNNFLFYCPKCGLPIHLERIKTIPPKKPHNIPFLILWILNFIFVCVIFKMLFLN